MAKKEEQRSTTQTHKTKDRTTRTPLKIGGTLRCSGRASSSCSTSGIRCVNLVTKTLIIHERGKDREVFTTSGTYPWSTGVNIGVSKELVVHIMRRHYQASVWIQAHLPSPVIPTVTDMGWDRKDGQLIPRLISLPTIPKACSELMSCESTKGGLSRLCSCRKISLPCIEACKCYKHGDECRNIIPGST